MTVPDLLTHVLLAYTVCLVLAQRVAWIQRPYVTVAMVGAMTPDLAKVHLVVSGWEIQRHLSIPVSWSALHTTGGVIISLLIIITIVRSPLRKRVGALLALGAGTHLVADAMLRSVTYRSFPIFWPLTTYRPPTPGLYLSTDPWLTAMAVVLAVTVTTLVRYRSHQT